jgi:hypothetical protein
VKVRYFEKRGNTWADFRVNGARKRMDTGAKWGDTKAAQAAVPALIARAMQEQEAGTTSAAALSNGPPSRKVAIEKPKSGKTLRATYKLGLKTRERWIAAKDKGDLEDRYQACADYWGEDRDLADCDRAAVLEWRRVMMETPGKRAGSLLSHSTINHRLSMLTTLLELADLPPHAVKHLSVKDSRRKRRTREEELQGVQAWLTANYHRKGAASFSDLILAALHTAARQGEWLSLLWADVYSDRAVVCFRDPKNGEMREVPLTDAVARMLERRRGYALAGPFADLTQDRCQDLWQSARKAIGLAHDHEFVFHVATRHEGLSRMGDAGASSFLIKAMAGHKSIQTSDRYVKPKVESLRAQAEAIANYGRRPSAEGGTRDKEDLS